MKIGFLGALLLLLIGLKLTGFLDWSWWWVLSPFWFPRTVALVLGVVILCLRAIDEAKR